MVGQVDLQWRDGNVSLTGGMKVGAFSFVFGGSGGSDPVHSVTARTNLGNDGFRRVAAPKSAQLDVSYLLKWQVWNVDIE